MGPPIRLVCAACGYRVPAGEPFPFRCPRGGEGDDTDHVLQRVLEPEAVAGGAALFDAAEPNPFLRYRELLCSWHAARAGGMDEGAFAELVAGLDRAVAAVDGREVGFRETPFAPADALGEALGLAPGQLWVKDETGNVAGSHKGRHLMGLMLWLEVAQRTGLAPAETAQRPLAIASCGNAALAAAVVAAAAAAGWRCSCRRTRMRCW